MLRRVSEDQTGQWPNGAFRLKSAQARQQDWKAEEGCQDASRRGPRLTSVLHLLPFTFSILKDPLYFT